MSQDTRTAFVSGAEKFPLLALMPFGKSSGCLSRRDAMRIARRFNAGNMTAVLQVPKGRLKLHSHSHFNRPFGTRVGGDVNPALKRRAIVFCPSGTGEVRRDWNSRRSVTRVRRQLAPRKCLALALVQLLAFALSGFAQTEKTKVEAESPATASVTRTDFKTVSPLLQKYCTDCHGGAEPENGLSLEFADARDVEQRLLKDYRVFKHMAERIRSGKMPPKKKAQPSDAERNVLLTWIDQELVAAFGAWPFGQVARVRRLTRVEYANTVRDLFYFDDFKAEDLPPDDIGYGFNNIADLFTVSTSHLERYLSTAELAIAQLDKTAKVSRNWAEKDGTYSEPDDGVFLPIKNLKLGFNNNQVRIRLVLEKFLPRAYRRPVAPEEIDRLMEFARLSLAQEGESFIRPKSAYATLRAALSSPYFLYRIEQDPPAGIAPINEYELASRLSYFLWSSMPDDELFNLAKENQLRAHQEEQVRRMLKDRKARALTENFAAQWLHLNGLKKVAPDPKLYPEFNEQLRQDMRRSEE